MHRHLGWHLELPRLWGPEVLPQTMNVGCLCPAVCRSPLDKAPAVAVDAGDMFVQGCDEKCAHVIPRALRCGASLAQDYKDVPERNSHPSCIGPDSTHPVRATIDVSDELSALGQRTCKCWSDAARLPR